MREEGGSCRRNSAVGRTKTQKTDISKSVTDDGVPFPGLKAQS